MSKMAITLNLAVLLLILPRLLVTPASAQLQQRPLPVARPGCRDRCGNITVPYPFGIGASCFRDDGLQGFQLQCDDSRSPPRLTVYGYNHRLSALYLAAGEARAYLNATRECYNSTGGVVSGNTGTYMSLGTSPYLFSAVKNRLVGLGCPNLSYFVDGTGYYVSGCMSVCRPSQYAMPGPCTGVGCCQSAIPTGVNFFEPHQLNFPQGQDPTFATNVTACHYVFLVEAEWFRYSDRVYLNRTDDFDVPVVLDWAVRNVGNCSAARRNATDYACRSARSECVDSSNGAGYRCNCSKGYKGNPYLDGGCRDIDECQQPDVYQCHGTCINVPGSYRCSSKKSISSLPGLITIIAISAGFGLLFSLLGAAKITNKLKQRRAKKLRQKFFKKNHGLLLQQLISSNKDIAERMKIFSLEELEQATNKFDQNRILGGGGHGTVYKGILSDQRVVAIKKSKIVVQREIDQFINEVVILSQTNHRNVVKLFGCCLETEVPLLVYEFVSNGTLSYHLHGQNENPLSWKDRLRIALETARAIAYLHSAASISVFHRDIKSANILLTDTLTAKVSDFGASRSISIDETGILTAIQGTYGYLDPEYYYTSRLTEKSDVYSFGVILAELMTRVTPVFSSQSSECTSLASYFVSLIRDKRLSDILDPQIVEEGGAADAEVVGTLAESCLSLKGEERPTMRQVETTLEDVQSSMVLLNSQITRVSQNALKDQSYKGSKGGEGTRQYSLEKEFIHSSEIPR